MKLVKRTFRLEAVPIETSKVEEPLEKGTEFVLSDTGEQQQIATVVGEGKVTIAYQNKGVGRRSVPETVTLDGDNSGLFVGSEILGHGHRTDRPILIEESFIEKGRVSTA